MWVGRIDVWWEFENGWSSEYRALSISGTKPSNDLGVLHWLKKHSYVKTCQKMSLVEVVCDVSFTIVQSLVQHQTQSFIGQHFGIGGPMKRFTVCHICHTTHLRSKSMALHEHSGGRPWGVLRQIASSEARLMVRKPMQPSYHWHVHGLNGSNRSDPLWCHTIQIEIVELGVNNADLFFNHRRHWIWLTSLWKLNRVPSDLLKCHGSVCWLINQGIRGTTLLIMTGSWHGLMNGILMVAIQTDNFFRLRFLAIDRSLWNSCHLKFPMIKSKPFEPNNDDLQKSWNNWKSIELEIKNVGSWMDLIPGGFLIRNVY